MLRSTLHPLYRRPALLGGRRLRRRTGPSRRARAVTVVNPFPAGGAAGVLTRLVAERLSRSWANRSSSRTRPAGHHHRHDLRGARRLGGYTVLMATNSTLVTNRFLYKELPYDPDGYAPIGMVGIGPLVGSSSPKQPFGKAADVVGYAKAHRAS